MDVRAVIVKPDLFGPGLARSGLRIKEDDVCFDAVRVKNSGRQAQNCMQIDCLKQPLAHSFAGAAFKQNVIGDDDRRLSGRFEQGFDVLDKIELLVAGRRPEVLAVIS